MRTCVLLYQSRKLRSVLSEIVSLVYCLCAWLKHYFSGIVKSTEKLKSKKNDAGSWDFFLLISTDLTSLTFLQQADCPTANDLLVNMS